MFNRYCVQLFATPRTAACQASLSFSISWSLPKLMSIELVLSSNYLILCRSLLLPPSIFPSIRVFSNEPILHIRWPKYWSFSFIISPSSEYSGLISFRLDWLDLLAVQGTLRSLLQHHSLKASILRCSAFFMVQFSFQGWIYVKQDQNSGQLCISLYVSTLPRPMGLWCSRTFLTHSILVSASCAGEQSKLPPHKTLWELC